MKEHPTATAPGPAEAELRGASPLALLAVLLRRPLILLGVPLALAAGAVALTLGRGPSYTAQSSFVPQTRDNGMSQLAGLAAQFGVGVNSASSGESVDFYVALLTSEELRRRVVETRFCYAEGEGERCATLVELYGVRGSPEARLRKAAKQLGRRVAVSTDAKAGLVRLEASGRVPELAIQVNRRMLSLVDEFNQKRRHTQAAAEQAFMRERLDAGQADLEAAESTLENFLERNRRYEGSPERAFEYGRLQRQVSMRQQVFSSLTQAYEQINLDAARNTPVITVVNEPEGAVRPEQKLPMNVVIALVLGGTLAVVYILGAEYLRSAYRRDPVHFDEVLTAGQRLVGMRRVSVSPVAAGSIADEGRGVAGGSTPPG